MDDRNHKKWNQEEIYPESWIQVNHGWCYQTAEGNRIQATKNDRL